MCSTFVNLSSTNFHHKDLTENHLELPTMIRDVMVDLRHEVVVETEHLRQMCSTNQRPTMIRVATVTLQTETATVLM